MRKNIPTEIITAIYFTFFVVFTNGALAQETNKTFAKSDSIKQAPIEKLHYGYQLIDKNDLAINVNVVDSSRFNKGFYISPLELIIGKVPGLQISSESGRPGGDFIITMRGITNLGTSSAPLIIVDNVQIIDGQIDLNTNDIASFVILKSVEAAILYGEKAADGAIIITTKKGGKEFKLNYTGKLGFSYLPRQANVFSGDEFREIIKDKFPDHPEYIYLLGNANTNWQNEIYRSAISQEHYWSISGSIRNLPYRISLSQTNQNGILKTSEYKRSTAAFNLNPSLFNNHLKIDLNLNTIFKNNRIANEDAIRNAVHFDPTQTIYADNEYGGYFTWYNDSGPVTFGSLNPVALLELTQNKLNSTRLIGNINLDYKLHFFPDLHIGFDYGIDYYKTNNTITEATTASWLYNAYGDGSGWIEEYNKTIRQETRNLFLQYSKNIKGISSKIYLSAGLFALNKDFSSDYTKDYIINPQTNIGGKLSTTSRQIAKYARLNYVLKETYVLNLSVRDEGSSFYNEEFNQIRSFLTAFKWKIKNEAFLSSFEALSELNLRISYGKTGATRYFSQTSNLTINPNIKPERITSANLGIDFGFFKGRISGSFDIYKIVSNDLFNAGIVPYGGNFSNQLLTNMGSLENKGAELALNLLAISRDDMSLLIGFNTSYNKNKITKLLLNDDPNYLGILYGDAFTGTIQITSVGYPAYSFFLNQQVYDANGNPLEGIYVDLSGDGVGIGGDNRDKYIYHSPAADVLFGLSACYRYKDWDLSFSGRLCLGNYVYNTFSSSAFYSNLIGMYSLSNSSTALNNTQFINLQYTSDYYVENASYFRMDYIRLGRQLGNLWRDKLKATLALTVQNAFVITKYTGLDPEVYNGIDGYRYPRSRTISLELNLNF